MRDRNLTVDTLRLLAAFEVVALHAEYTSLPDWLAIAIRLQARWAVPFFFVLSGYYLGERLADPERADVRPSIYRLLWVLGLWSLIYIPVVLSQHDVREVFRRLLFSSFPYVGTYFHLWFPSSLVLGFLFLLFCKHYRLEKLLPLFSLLIVVHVLLAGAYDVFDIKFPFEFETARHWVSIPLMYIGMLLFRRGPFSWPVALLLAAGGLALQAVEAYWLLMHYDVSPYNHEILIGTIPFAVGLASLGLSGLRPLQVPLLSRWGRELSLGIYLSHALMAYLLGALLSWWTPTAALLPAWELIYPLVLLGACIFALSLLQKWTPYLFKFLLGTHIEQA